MKGFNTTLDKGGNGGGGGAAAQLAVSITYAALVALRDGDNLVPGTWYRITDYVCTTTQENTQAASNAFDILVHADDESHLNENAFAAHHDGDTYFQDCMLEAWELKYCLDNDAARFGWADTTNGTGVVYWMKDEWDNEAPYDFKNIKFSRTLTDGAYDAQGTAAYVYTFNSYADGTSSDATVLATSNNKIRCCNNVITERRNTSSGDYKLLLNDNVFLNVYSQFSGYTCSGNILGLGSCNNTFGSGSNHLNIGSNCGKLNIGSNVVYVTIGSYVSDSQIGSYVSDSQIGSNVRDSQIGSDCSYLDIGSGSNHLNIGSNVHDSQIGSNSHHLDIGSNSHHLDIGSNVHDSQIGSDCSYLDIGSYCYNFTIFNGVAGIAVTTGTQQSPVRNCMILSGEYGGKDPVEIGFTADQNQTQVATLDSNGDVVVYIPGQAPK